MATRDLTVISLGYDSSGRPLRMTRWMYLCIQAVKRHPLIAPFAWKIVVVQGAFMRGSGASASDGFHDYAGCIDFRTWNLTDDEITRLVWVLRLFAFGAWRRDYYYRHGGMAEHLHATLGSDYPLSYGAKVSWSSYVSGGDGLSGPYGDYERRPNPLVLVPPAHLLEEPFMTDAAERKLDRVLERINNIDDDLTTFRTGEAKRDKEARRAAEKAAEKAKESKKTLVSAIAGVVDLIGTTATTEQLMNAKKALLKAMADDPDVDGLDNPVVE